jgi:acyl transferase domain-containing protein
MLKNEISEFDIAIIGMACRFPKAKNINEYWDNLRSGLDCTRFTAVDELTDSDGLSHEDFVGASIPLEDKEQFDANFFKMSPADSVLMDPQIRGLLQTSWNTLEDAGYDSFNYDGAIGNFCSMGTGSYLYLLMKYRPDLAFRNPLLTRHLNEKDFLATHISYKLNLKGPAISVQSACSSSLLAVHLACQSLLSNECDMALAGGVQIDSLGSLGYTYTEGSILSPDGYCRAFDKDAQGTVPGNGMGMVLLKKLTKAIDDGDNIYAVIKGSAANNDGSNKMSYSAPSVDGQREAILEALSVGDVDADTIELIEAHGTGTVLGDPVEVTALKEAFDRYTERRNYCALTSVKTNIGHLDCAAGIASFIKAVLCVHHGEFVPTLNYRQPNPALGLDKSPFYVSEKCERWTSVKHPRRAGVSSLGVGGTNVHTVIEQYGNINTTCTEQSYYFIALSAKTAKSLSGLKNQLITQLNSNSTLDLANIEHTLAYGRHHFEHKFSAICKSKEELLRQLDNLENNLVIEGKSAHEQNSIVFMYPGQGNQFVDMALGLFSQNEVFKEHLKLCFSIADKYLNFPLESYLFGNNRVQLSQTNISQIAILSIEYSLTKLWESWGVFPSVVIGHSLGEYSAALASGIMSLEDAIKLIYFRGHLMSELPTGDMISVDIPSHSINNILCDGVVVASINGPQQTVLSGNVQSIKNQKQILLSNEISFKDLNTSHAFHSPMMEEMLTSFKEKLESIDFKKSKVPFYSTLKGGFVDDDILCSPQYWLDQIIQPVQFEKTIESLSSQYRPCLFLEVGPGSTLCSLTKSILKNPRIAFPCLPKIDKTDLELRDICYLRSLLWHSNVPSKAPKFNQKSGTRKISLLGTVFDTQPYWVESVEIIPSTTSHSPSIFNNGTNLSKDGLAYSNALSMQLDIVLPDAGSISDSQSKELALIQQKLVNDVQLLFQDENVNVNVVSSIKDKIHLIEDGVELDKNTCNKPVSTLANRLIDTKYVLPSNKIETFLATLWQSILGYQPVGINDNFFAVGGDSLIATQLLKTINKEFKTSLTFKDISENQTVSDLAKAIELRKWLKETAFIDGLEEDTERFEL